MIAFRVTRHAAAQAAAKGFDMRAVVRAAVEPTVTYANGRYAGQMRHIREGIVAVVDTRTRTIVTVYANVVETDLRADQTDRDAMRYGKRKAMR